MYARAHTHTLSDARGVISSEGGVGKELVLHAARALRKVAGVSFLGHTGEGRDVGARGQAAAAASRVLLLVAVCQVVSSSHLQRSSLWPALSLMPGCATGV